MRRPPHTDSAEAVLSTLGAAARLDICHGKGRRRLPSPSLSGGALVAGMVPARCGDTGFLLIGRAPEMGSSVLPGNNFHIYDIPLFGANIRADFARRVAAWYAGPK